MEFHIDGSQPRGVQVFVFGSNLSGIHGAGAALLAKTEYGARYGQGIGMSGSSYAIPTKDENIVTLRLARISEYIEQFNEFAKSNPHQRFFVTRVGCGLAGYTDKQIAPMFEPLDNCNFAEEWKPYLLVK